MTSSLFAINDHQRQLRRRSTATPSNLRTPLRRRSTADHILRAFTVLLWISYSESLASSSVLEMDIAVVDSMKKKIEEVIKKLDHKSLTCLMSKEMVFGRQNRKLAVARQRRQNGRSRFIVAQNPQGLLSCSDESFLGTIIANLMGSKFHIWDQGRARSSFKTQSKRLLGVVGFVPTITTITGSFRIMKAWIPKQQAMQLKNSNTTQTVKLFSNKEHIGFSNVNDYPPSDSFALSPENFEGKPVTLKEGLLINFIHSFWPSLLKIKGFMVEFITPIVKATHRSGKVLAFYTIPEYEAWKESFSGHASGWSIKYYKGLGTSTEVKESMMESMVKFPHDLEPCVMPQPFSANELKVFLKRKADSITKVQI